MDPITIVTTAVKGIQLTSMVLGMLSKAIEMANTGNQEEAEKLLAQARKHFSSSLEEWEKAGN